jgi:pyruvate kinase
VDLVAESVRRTLERVEPAAVFVPTVSGATARRICSFRPREWIVAVTPHEETCRHLLLSCGVLPVCEPGYPEDWNRWIRKWLEDAGMRGEVAILTEGPSARHPDANHRMEIIELRRV